MPIIMTRPYTAPGLPVGTYRSIIHSYNPIAYWYFDGNPANDNHPDQSTSGLYLADMGSTSTGHIGSDRALPYGAAIFTGQYYLQTFSRRDANPAFSTAVSGTSLTIATWFKGLSNFGDINPYWSSIISAHKDDFTINHPFTLRWRANNVSNPEHPEVIVNDGNGASVITHQTQGNPLVWAHLVVTMDWDTEEVAFYFDGVKANTTLTTDKWKIYDSNYDWEAGHRMNTSGNRTDLAEGYFDDTAFLPVALNEAEVINLYNSRNVT